MDESTGKITFRVDGDEVTATVRNANGGVVHEVSLCSESIAMVFGEYEPDLGLYEATFTLKCIERFLTEEEEEEEEEDESEELTEEEQAQIDELAKQDARAHEEVAKQEGSSGLA